MPVHWAGKPTADEAITACPEPCTFGILNPGHLISRRSARRIDIGPSLDAELLVISGDLTQRAKRPRHDPIHVDLKFTAVTVYH